MIDGSDEVGMIRFEEFEFVGSWVGEGERFDEGEVVRRDFYSEVGMFVGMVASEELGTYDNYA